ncbi:mucin-2-like isoform X2 [Leptopilina heterotoma]|uniref:mucin-2-like isoform X2 n=1 Tax=Leptopilina heterotoma TaxID=63436 RepID=UPI001CA8C521|nr:mucin-2-like isoform X2 [Leptopilina heterotoma]
MSLFFNIVWIFLHMAVASDNIEWKESEKKVSIDATLQNCGKTYCKETCRMISWYDRIYHHKTHFGIIVKSGTDITITLSANVDDLMFFCLSQSPMGEYIAIKLKEKKGKSIKTNFDCVPMISDSYNRKVTVTIKTKSWIELPVFKSNDVTSKETESAFYKDLQLYGFVENTYTQMLLSSEEITTIKKENYSLNDGLLNQKKVLKYYDSLFGVGTERDWLQPSGKSTWMLLTEFGHYYQIDDNLIGFGKVSDVWSMMFAVLFQRTNGEEIYSMTTLNSEHETVVKRYQSSDVIDKWSSEEKLHFFLSLFEYGGDDRILEEFHKRHASEKSNFEGKVNIIPILVNLFLEMHQVNIFPYLEKVIDFKSYVEPLINADLELLLVTGRSVMPALDFNLSSTDWSNMIEKRGFKQTSALTLFSKVEEKPVGVKFIISPFTEPMRGISFYLNNKAHTIGTESFALTLPRDVYSVYIAEKSYISDVRHHVIATNDSTITIHVKEIKENDISSPLIHSSINVNDGDGKPLLNVIINYKDKTISFLQLSNNFQNNKLSIQLRRDSKNIFSYVLSKSSNKITGTKTYTFEMNDRLFIDYNKPENVIINGRKLNDLITPWRTFVFAENVFRHIAYPEPNFKDKFTITAKGYNNVPFLVIDIDYNKRIMSFKLKNRKPHYSFHKRKPYFAVKLQRNNEIRFNFSLLAKENPKKPLTIEKSFEINDKLHLFHAESPRLFIDGKNIRQVLTGQLVDRQILLLTKLGLVDADDMDEKLLKENIKQLENFNTLHNKSLQDNPLYHYHLNNYVRSLRKENYTDDIPNVWQNFGTEPPETTTQEIVTTTISAMSVEPETTKLTSSSEVEVTLSPVLQILTPLKAETTTSTEVPKQATITTLSLSPLSSESKIPTTTSENPAKLGEIASSDVIQDNVGTNSTQTSTITDTTQNSSITIVTPKSSFEITETIAKVPPISTPLEETEAGLLSTSDAVAKGKTTASIEVKKQESLTNISLTPLSAEKNATQLDSNTPPEIPTTSENLAKLGEVASSDVIQDNVVTNSTETTKLTDTTQNSSTTIVTTKSSSEITETTVQLPQILLPPEANGEDLLSTSEALATGETTTSTEVAKQASLIAVLSPSILSESNASLMESSTPSEITTTISKNPTKLGEVASPGLIPDNLVTNSTETTTITVTTQNSSTTITPKSSFEITETIAKVPPISTPLEETEAGLLSTSDAVAKGKTTASIEVKKQESLTNISSTPLSAEKNATQLDSNTPPEIPTTSENLAKLGEVASSDVTQDNVVTNSTETSTITDTTQNSSTTITPKSPSGITETTVQLPQILLPPEANGEDLLSTSEALAKGKTTASIEVKKQESLTNISSTPLSAEKNATQLDSNTPPEIPTTSENLAKLGEVASSDVTQDNVVTNSTETSTITDTTQNSSTTITPKSPSGITETTVQLPQILLPPEANGEDLLSTSEALAKGKTTASIEVKKQESLTNISSTPLSAEKNATQLDSNTPPEIPTTSENLAKLGEVASSDVIQDNVVTNSTQTSTITVTTQNSSTTITPKSPSGITETIAKVPPISTPLEETEAGLLSTSDAVAKGKTTASIEVKKQESLTNISSTPLSAEKNATQLDSNTPPEIPTTSENLAILGEVASSDMIQDNVVTNSTETTKLTDTTQNSSTTIVTTKSSSEITETTVQLPQILLPPDATGEDLLSTSEALTTGETTTSTEVAKQASLIAVLSPSILSESNASLMESSTPSEITTTISKNPTKLGEVASPGLIPDNLVTNSTETTTITVTTQNSSTTITPKSPSGITETIAKVPPISTPLEETEAGLLSTSDAVAKGKTTASIEVKKQESLTNISSTPLSAEKNATQLDSNTPPEIPTTSENLAKLGEVASSDVIQDNVGTNSTQTSTITDTTQNSSITIVTPKSSFEITETIVQLSQILTPPDATGEDLLSTSEALATASTEVPKQKSLTTISLPPLSSESNSTLMETNTPLEITTTISKNFAKLGEAASSGVIQDNLVTNSTETTTIRNTTQNSANATALPHTSLSKIPWYRRNSAIFLPIFILSLILFQRRGAF